MKLHRLPAPALLGCALFLAGTARAADPIDAGFLNEASFLVSAGAVQIEGFETLPGRVRSMDAITAPLLTLSTTVAPIGVQAGADAPETGYGSAAVEGSHYVSVYLPNLAQGSVRFTLAAPSLVFGLYLTDVGEAEGRVTLTTNAGSFAGDLILANYPPTLGNGNQQFFGLIQTQAFTEVVLTVTGVDDAYGIDKVYVGAVPEPASAALLGLGLAAGLARRRGSARA